MSAVRRLKESVFRAAGATGLSKRIGSTRWRQNRLLILCYHSISIRDEHLWRPELFMSRERFVRRLEILREGHYEVLPLAEAFRLARLGRLPKRAVALTFDDGTEDFGRIVWPLLRRHGFPATVYLTTYYAERRYPVFNVAIRYALWKSGQSYELPNPTGMNGEELDEMARRISSKVGFDWSELTAAGMFQIMSPERVTEVARDGCDIQLHTHRHRSPAQEHEFRREIAENRLRIETWTGKTPVHFCYPSGIYRPEFFDWLGKEGVETAVTTDPGMVGCTHDPYVLNRFVDTMYVTEAKFRAWLDGTAALLPRRGR